MSCSPGWSKPDIWQEIRSLCLDVRAFRPPLISRGDKFQVYMISIPNRLKIVAIQGHWLLLGSTRPKKLERKTPRSATPRQDSSRKIGSALSMD